MPVSVLNIVFLQPYAIETVVAVLLALEDFVVLVFNKIESDEDVIPASLALILVNCA